MQLMPMIQQKFWTKDGNNLPLSFGSLTFYYHGTTDFAPTYQNNGGAENDNPLALDINGECQVWLDPAISYDIILKDADGADIDTREAVQVGDGGGSGGDAYTVKVTALDSTPNTLNYKINSENAGIRVSTTGSAGTNQALQIGVKLSTDPTNAASLDATGLFVSQGRQGPPGPAGVIGSVVDTDSIDLTLTGDVLQADVRISSTIGNGLTLNADGLYSSGTPSVSDTNSIDLTISSGVLSGDVKISATAGNNISVSADGLYSATPDLSGYILKNGMTTTTAQVPFAKGIKVYPADDAQGAAIVMKDGSWIQAETDAGFVNLIGGIYATNSRFFAGPSTVSMFQSASRYLTVTNGGFLLNGIPVGTPDAGRFLGVDSSGYIVKSDLSSELGSYIKKDGSTTTTASIPLSFGASALFIDYLTYTTPAYAEGRTYYDFTNHNLQLMTEFSDVTQSIGEELFIHCRNNTGSIIPNGSIVYISGAVGNKPTIALATNLDLTMDNRLIGMTTHDIGINVVGIVTTYGIVHGVNTNGLTEGALVYLTTGGAWSTTIPTTGYTMQVGIVNYAHISNGEILVKTRSVPAGEVIGSVTKDYTGWDNPTLVSESYDSATRIVTVSGTAKLYQDGKLVLDLATGPLVSTAHTATNGTWYWYYNAGVYSWSQTPWEFYYAQIAGVVYQTSYKFGIRECHGLMPWTVHRDNHFGLGTLKLSGGSASGYVLASTTAANRRPAIAATVLLDEDLETTLPLLGAGSYTTLYLSGASGTPTFTTAYADICPISAGINIQYNQWTGSTWQLTVVAAVNRWVNIWLLAIPVTSDATSQAYRYVWVVGQTLHTTTASALSETTSSLNLTTFTSALNEFVFITKFTLQAQAANWTIYAVTDISGSKVSQGQISGGGLASVSVTDSATVTWTGDGTPSTPLVATAVGFVNSSGHTDLGTMPWSIGDGASVAASTGAYTIDTASITYKNQFKGGLSVDGWMFTNGRVEAQLALWSQASTSGLVYGYMANQGALIASGSDSSRMILEHTAATSGRRVFDQLCKNTSVFWRWLSDDASALNKECFAVDTNGTMLLAQNLKIGSIPTGTQTYLLGQDSTGQVIRGSTPISATVGNAITLNADGVYAPTPAVATTTTSLIQTVEKANTTTITMPSAWTMYGYCDRMPYGGTFNSIDVISPNGLGGSGTGIRGFIGKVTSRTAGNYTATILARTANYATNSTGLVNIALSNSATLLQGEEWCLILRVDKSASGDLLALVPSAGLSSSNYLSLGENVAGTDPAVGATITFYAGTPAMLPWVRALA